MGPSAILPFHISVFVGAVFVQVSFSQPYCCCVVGVAFLSPQGTNLMADFPVLWPLRISCSLFQMFLELRCRNYIVDASTGVGTQRQLVSGLGPRRMRATLTCGCKGKYLFGFVFYMSACCVRFFKLGVSWVDKSRHRFKVTSVFKCWKNEAAGSQRRREMNQRLVPAGQKQPVIVSLHVWTPNLENPRAMEPDLRQNPQPLRFHFAQLYREATNNKLSWEPALSFVIFVL